MIIFNIMLFITAIVISLTVMFTFPKMMEYLDKKFKSSPKS